MTEQQNPSSARVSRSICKALTKHHEMIKSRFLGKMKGYWSIMSSNGRIWLKRMVWINLLQSWKSSKSQLRQNLIRKNEKMKRMIMMPLRRSQSTFSFSQIPISNIKNVCSHRHWLLTSRATPLRRQTSLIPLELPKLLQTTTRHGWTSSWKRTNAIHWITSV